MRLRNKKTGVIGEVGYISTSTGDILVSNIHDQEEWYHYKSLAELNEEWEDYEEPKTFFTIYYDGTISEFRDGDDEQIRDMKAIGNYFETREEAELAVRKLKAWKRLKDKGFRFIGLGKDRYGTEDIKYDIELPTDIKGLGIIEGLNTCFGGEE